MIPFQYLDFNLLKNVLFVFLPFISLYIGVSAYLYFAQNSLLFHPEVLPKNYVFSFPGKFEEVFLPTSDGNILNGLYFSVDAKQGKQKGVIFYLHGNAGSLATWGNEADIFIQEGFDVFMIDYRGFGKSTGSMKNEKQAFEDVETAYLYLNSKKPHLPKVVIGYSLGTGMASYIANKFQPNLLILQAPYYSLIDMTKIRYPFAPAFLLKYPFETSQYITGVKSPVVIISADKDEVIPKESTSKLQPLLKSTDSYYELINQGHNGFSENDEYLRFLRKVLLAVKVYFQKNES